ncbi:methyl-accepting chemotaxis protein [Marinobacter persicus]|uniref:Methyl-accepting chemotaxis sensory transducer n=1 Tax=Marinobacter persicus TaxID=930118 RepID=A0A2S6G8F6_9GAMM|nr:methyl-accepting chemotaxis protein [Marinobacter persicus]PPK52356.1 methyl-accepting chemotaxis sensory transducer [Marinobacter persicus]PPK55332.1 methyl-accepting chemotaxis sensory transducer [Marinobacter persicus]PPK59099.1 methyl-accepting chemotaxis sensory transducer [Marinobacter persicus]
MAVLNNLSLKLRLTVLVLIPLSAIAGLSIYALVVFADINRGVSSIYNDRVVPLKDLKIISDEYAVNVVDAINKVNAGLLTPEAAVALLTDAQGVVERRWNDYTGTLLTAKEQTLVNEVEALFADADQAIAKAITLLERAPANARGQLDAIDGPLYTSIDPVTSKIAELIDLQLEVAAEAHQDVSSLYDFSKVLYPVVAVLVGLVALIASVLIIMSITRPLGAMRQLMAKVTAESDVSARVVVQGRDELAELGHSLNTMLGEFDDIIVRFSAISEEVATASEELSSINADTEKNVEAQSEQTDQVATAMHQMSAASSDVARSADEAQSAALEAKNLGGEGREAGNRGREALERLSADIRRVSDRINALETKSGDIQRVTQVINDIADQTNLLALNAAIEAARAGEHGRGFSVVADEVRSLARRTQSSTAEISEVINGLTEESKAAVAVMQSGLEQVEDNRMLIEEIAQTINSMSDAIERISQMGEQIASASEEQSVAAEQVSGNLTHIVDFSSQNLTGARQSSEASQELARLSAEMQERFSVFKTSA